MTLLFHNCQNFLLNFEEKKSEVEEDIKNIDILNITPIEAINFLSKLKEKIK